MKYRLGHLEPAISVVGQHFKAGNDITLQRKVTQAIAIRRNEVPNNTEEILSDLSEEHVLQSCNSVCYFQSNKRRRMGILMKREEEINHLRI